MRREFFEGQEIDREDWRTGWRVFAIGMTLFFALSFGPDLLAML